MLCNWAGQRTAQPSIRLVTVLKTCVESIPRPLSEPAFVHHQAGTIPFRIHPVKGLEYLLITNRSGTKWVFPKGHIEIGTTAAHQASVEAYEEAGVLGKLLLPSAGVFDYRKGNATYRVTVFLLHVEREVDHWPEASTRRRSWKSFADALLLHGRDEAQQVFSIALRSIEERFTELADSDLQAQDPSIWWRAAS
jgi:8-oxo-dGTP pyrophosphatase MutT (NUDIX family)